MGAANVDIEALVFGIVWLRPKVPLPDTRRNVAERLEGFGDGGFPEG